MPNSFTHYWTEKRNDDKQGSALRHVASNEFQSRGIRAGDTIFCFTQHVDRLFLIARMVVDQVTDAITAAQYVGSEIGFADRIDHCVCSEQHGSPIRFDRPIPTEVVRQLRFETQGGQTSGVAMTTTGGVQQQAMRTVRRLTADSAELLNQIIESEADPEQTDLAESYEAEEWRSKLVLHLRRERDRRIVELKKASVSSLVCECCDFNFASAYGEWGAGFIECHHCRPLAALEEGQRTRIEDLALVCANCHRILHRSTTLLSISKLRQIITTQRQQHANPQSAS